MTYYKYYTQLYLRKGTIFVLHNKIQALVLFKILKFLLCDDLNLLSIKSKLEELYDLNNIDTRFMYIFISNMREKIVNYLKNIYSIESLCDINAYNHIACNESLFSHNNGLQ